MSKGLELIAAERKVQVYVKGYTPEHDAAEHADGSLKVAAAHLLESIDEETGLDVSSFIYGRAERGGEWIERLCEEHRDDELRRLTIAGALIAAEIDRQIEAEKNGQ